MRNEQISNKFGFTRGTALHNVVLLNKRMLDGFLKPQSCLLLIFENANVEGEGPCLLLDLREDRSGCFHLELVADSRIFLVDGGSRVFRTSLDSL